jgi:lipid-binding SYLF domain-containing protein
VASISAGKVGRDIGAGVDAVVAIASSVFALILENISSAVFVRLFF